MPKRLLATFILMVTINSWAGCDSDRENIGAITVNYPEVSKTDKEKIFIEVQIAKEINNVPLFGVSFETANSPNLSVPMFLLQDPITMKKLNGYYYAELEAAEYYLTNKYCIRASYIGKTLPSGQREWFSITEHLKPNKSLKDAP